MVLQSVYIPRCVQCNVSVMVGKLTESSNRAGSVHLCSGLRGLPEIIRYLENTGRVNKEQNTIKLVFQQK